MLHPAYCKIISNFKSFYSVGFSSYFSGQTIYDPILDTLYNIIFTAYPIGWFATYDKELNYDKLESSPDLYEIGMKNKLMIG